MIYDTLIKDIISSEECADKQGIFAVVGHEIGHRCVGCALATPRNAVSTAFSHVLSGGLGQRLLGSRQPKKDD